MSYYTPLIPKINEVMRNIINVQMNKFVTSTFFLKKNFIIFTEEVYVFSNYFFIFVNIAETI